MNLAHGTHRDGRISKAGVTAATEAGIKSVAARTFIGWGALVLAAALAASCGKSGDVSGGGGVKLEVDTTGMVPADPALPMDTLRVASLNMSIGFPVAQLLFTNMDIDTVAYNALHEMYATYQKGYPSDRVKAMAREVVAESLDVVGLQEVMSLWKSGVLINDFLAELRAEIKALGGPDYTVFSTILNDTLLSGRKGDSSITITFQEGNAVLVRPGIMVLDSSRNAFFNLLKIQLAHTVVTERSVDYLRLKTPRGVEFQVFNTHLEVITGIRVSQGRELAKLTNGLQLRSQRAGKVHGKLQIILGDFNCSPSTEAHLVMEDTGFVDTFRGPGVAQDEGLTCCVKESQLWDPKAPFTNRRIDYVMARGLVAPILSRTRVKGVFTTPDSIPFLASDHRMVVSHFTAQ